MRPVSGRERLVAASYLCDREAVRLGGIAEGLPDDFESQSALSRATRELRSASQWFAAAARLAIPQR